jgi:hypothetical protein
MLVFSIYRHPELFTDTLNYLPGKLEGRYGECMATYTAMAVRRYQSGDWVSLPKEGTPAGAPPLKRLRWAMTLLQMA